MTKIVFAILLLAPVAFELGRASVIGTIDWRDYVASILIITVGIWAICSKK